MTIIQPQIILPAGITVIEAVNRGLLPLQVRVMNSGTGQPNGTLHSLLSSGVVKHLALASSLVFETTYDPVSHVAWTVYGGY